MNLSLLLVPALSGYWFLTRVYRTRYRTSRQTGYMEHEDTHPDMIITSYFSKSDHLEYEQTSRVRNAATQP